MPPITRHDMLNWAGKSTALACQNMMTAAKGEKYHQALIEHRRSADEKVRQVLTAVNVRL
jgi:hypothetical protein